MAEFVSTTHPENLTVELQENNSAILNWDNRISTNGVKVYRYGSPTENIAVLGPDETSFVDGTREDDHTYTYFVQAFNDTAESPPSNEVVLAASRFPWPLFIMRINAPKNIDPPPPPPSIPTVVSKTGRVWMDRNLGASRVAQSVNDSLAYGDLFQWGRLADGHQKRTSSTTTNTSTTDNPGHGSFILKSTYPQDWRTPQNNNLWQGVSGTNNPCPSGFRLPTHSEFARERDSWSSNTISGAFASPLKFVAAGSRKAEDGTLSILGSAHYWSSTVDDYGSSAARYLWLGIGANINDGDRADGRSVRCIKN